jgi:hypothetical protein
VALLPLPPMSFRSPAGDRACTVDQARDRPYPCRVVAAVVPVHLAQRLVATQPIDAVLHRDPPPRERPVVPPVRRRPLLPPRLAPGRRPAQSRADAFQADVPQVAEDRVPPRPTISYRFRAGAVTLGRTFASPALIVTRRGRTASPANYRPALPGAAGKDWQ